MAEGTREIHFKAHIKKYLHEKEGCSVINPDRYDKELCLVTESLIAFIQEIQPKVYEELQKQYGSSANEKNVQNVAKQIRLNKTLDILRNRIKDRGQKLRLAYFKPANNKTHEHDEWREYFIEHGLTK